MTHQKTPINDRACMLIRSRREKYGTPYTHISLKVAEAGVRLTPQMLKRIEHGERRPTIDELCAIFAVLDIHMTELLGDHPAMACNA